MSGCPRCLHGASCIGQSDRYRGHDQSVDGVLDDDRRQRLCGAGGRVADRPLLSPAQQRGILASIAAAATSAPAVFQWGEDERLARAAASIFGREDADTATVGAFLDSLKATGDGVDWDQPLAGNGLAPMLNAKAVLKDLHLVLTVSSKDAMRQQVLSRLEAMP